MLKNISFSVFNKVFLGLLGLLRIPVLLNYLGEELFGIFILLTAISTYAALFDFGIFPTLKNRLIKHFTNNDMKFFLNDLFLTLSMSILLGIVSLFVAFILYCIDLTLIFNELKNQNHPIDNINITISVAFLLSGFRLSTSGILTTFDAKNEFIIPKIAETISETVSFCLLLGIVYLYEKAFLSIVFIIFLFPVIKNIFLFYFIRKEIFMSFQYHRKIYFTKEIKYFITHSSHFFGIQLCSIVLSTIPLFYISKFYSLTILTEFNILYRLISIPTLILSAILPIFWREFGFLWTKQNFILLSQKISYYALLTSFLFILFGGFLYLFLDTITLFWLGKAYSFDIFIFLILLWVAVESLMYWYSTFLHSIGDFYFEFKSYFLATALIVIFGYWFALNQPIEYFLFFILSTIFVTQLIPMLIRSKQRLHHVVVK